jgi:hypothetical protein
MAESLGPHLPKIEVPTLSNKDLASLPMLDTLIIAFYLRYPHSVNKTSRLLSPISFLTPLHPSYLKITQSRHPSQSARD